MTTAGDGPRVFRPLSATASYLGIVVFSGPGTDPISVQLNLHFGGSLNSTPEAAAQALADASLGGSTIGELQSPETLPRSGPALTSGTVSRNAVGHWLRFLDKHSSVHHSRDLWGVKLQAGVLPDDMLCALSLTTRKSA